MNSVLKFLQHLDKEKKKYAAVARQTGIFLYNFGLAVNVKNILEIGTGIGYSTIWLAMAVKKNNGNILSYENNTCNAIKAENNLKKCFLNDFVKIISRDAVKEIPNLNDEKYDLIFIDGSNKKYYQFVDLCFEKLKTNGYIICDNVLELGLAQKTLYQYKIMQKFIDQIKKDKRFECLFLDVGTGLCIIRKNFT